jgi:hypothetical protein
MTGDDGWRAIAHVWRSENERLLEIIEAHGLNATCVEYDEVLTTPDCVAQRLSGFVGQAVRPVGVRVDLRHHRSEMPHEFAELYERVRGVGAGR